jgi:ferritin-like protein
MNASRETDFDTSIGETAPGVSRRAFFKRATVIGATAAAALSVLGSFAVPSAEAEDNDRVDPQPLKKGDRDILIAAQIAEALAVTTYTHIIHTAPFFNRLAPDDQGYLKAALQEEMSHYLLEQDVTDQFTPFSSFFYPHSMFANAHVTLNTLVTLEDAFIAAYLVGVRNFSTTHLRVTAARIMGIESDHRTLARVLAPGVAAMDGGPIEKVTGAQGVAESVDPPNNNGYERTLCWTSINQAVAALLPFVNKAAAEKARFNTAKSYPFEPFNPTLPNPLGEFISFKGC